MGFWTHSFKNRREADYFVLTTHERDLRDLAGLLLAGWRFEPSGDDYNTWGPDGQYHGFNASIENAVKYAMGIENGIVVLIDHPGRTENIER